MPTEARHPGPGRSGDPLAGLTVLQRGWLSSNNVLIHPAPGEPGAVLVDASHVNHAAPTEFLRDSSDHPLGNNLSRRRPRTKHPCGRKAVQYDALLLPAILKKIKPVRKDNESHMMVVWLADNETAARFFHQRKGTSSVHGKAPSHVPGRWYHQGPSWSNGVAKRSRLCRNKK